MQTSKNPHTWRACGILPPTRGGWFRDVSAHRLALRPVEEPDKNSTMDQPRQRALELIAAHDDDLQGVLDDDELNEALESVREDRPRLLRCGRPHCNGKLLYVAISPYQPRVLGSPLASQNDEYAAKKRRKHDLPPSSVSAALPPLFAHWPVGPSGGHEYGETPPEDEHLHPHHRLRRTLTCRRPRCRTRFLVTHTQLLTLIVGTPSREIVLPESLALPDLQVPPGSVERGTIVGDEKPSKSAQ